jgi:hypothetical protein
VILAWHLLWSCACSSVEVTPTIFLIDTLRAAWCAVHVESARLSKYTALLARKRAILLRVCDRDHSHFKEEAMNKEWGNKKFDQKMSHRHSRR